MTSIARRLFNSGESRSSLALPFQDWINYFNYNGTQYPFLTGLNQTMGREEKPVPQDYTGVVTQLVKSNAVVYALLMVRMLHFAEARFQWQQLRNGRPANLFGTAELGVLEVPWLNGTTQDLLSKMIQAVDIAGNSYTVREGDRLAQLRPDWVSILMGSRSSREGWLPGDADTEVLAYIYKPGGPGSKAEEIIYTVDQVAHWAPYPDPLATYRGMSWLTPLIREAMADSAMTNHKNKFLEQGATVNLAIKIDTDNLDLFEKWVEKLDEGHRGAANAYKTLYLGSGATPIPVGSTLEQMSFKEVQGSGETRMAAAAGVPAIIVGFSEGLSGSSLNAGNYQTARRRLADGTIRPLWASASGALQTIVNIPAQARLWYDDRHIAFLKEDMKEAADVRQANATTISTLVAAGFEPNAAVDAVVSDDFGTLANQHTGLTSVQLQPPMTNNVIPGPANTNGSSKGTIGHPIVPAQ